MILGDDRVFGEVGSIATCVGIMCGSRENRKLNKSEHM